METVGLTFPTKKVEAEKVEVKDEKVEVKKTTRRKKAELKPDGE